MILSLIGGFNSSAAQTGIVLSEVMFNPAGNESYNEFIEIYNQSDADVDLTGWLVGDGTQSDTIIDAGKGLVLAHGQFGIILDPGYFANSTMYDSTIPDTALVLTIDNASFGAYGLNNSVDETITLIDRNGVTIAAYTYSTPNPDGISDEKIIPSGGDEIENWLDSRILNGTPGFSNSVSPPGIDLHVGGILVTPYQPMRGESFRLEAFVVNNGETTVESFSVTFFADIDLDSLVTASEELAEPLIADETLLPGDSMIVGTDVSSFQWSRQKIGVHVAVEGDEISSNDYAFIEISIGYEDKSIIINEIMYHPLSESDAFSGQSEYVEIFNLSGSAIYIDGWSISDADTSRLAFIRSTGLRIAAGGYTVIAADSVHFSFFSPEDETTIIAGSEFPRLNNDGDVLHLFDPTGEIIDMVAYDDSWGGGKGYSLERIDPGAPSNKAGNWTSCTESLGGTPGRKNSVSAESLPEEASLALTPNPFSPEGDGIDDHLRISYAFPAPFGTVDIYIFDSIGRQIRRLAYSEPTGSEGVYLWDGTNDRGRKSTVGIYIIFVEITSPSNGKVYQIKEAAVLARKL